MGIGEHQPVQPGLEHIIGGENELLSIFLRGHLVIEALLNQMIQSVEHISDKKLSKMTFAKKNDRCFDIGLFGNDFYEFLSQMNRIRNSFAHRLGYDLSEAEVHQLIQLAGRAPEVDFSDDMHQLDIKTLYEWYGNTSGVLMEMFKHVAMDLSFIVEANGGAFMFT